MDYPLLASNSDIKYEAKNTFFYIDSRIIGVLSDVIYINEDATFRKRIDHPPPAGMRCLYLDSICFAVQVKNLRCHIIDCISVSFVFYQYRRNSILERAYIMVFFIYQSGGYCRRVKEVPGLFYSSNNYFGLSNIYRVPVFTTSNRTEDQ